MREQMINKIVEILSGQSLWVIEQVYRAVVSVAKPGKGGAC